MYAGKYHRDSILGHGVDLEVGWAGIKVVRCKVPEQRVNGSYSWVL